MQFNSYNSNLDAPQTLADKKKSMCISKAEVKKSGPTHKKSHSLFNKKITDIIAGLQQSLGVITSNVKKSLNNEELGSILKQSN